MFSDSILGHSMMKYSVCTVADYLGLRCFANVLTHQQEAIYEEYIWYIEFYAATYVKGKYNNVSVKSLVEAYLDYTEDVNSKCIDHQ